MAAGGFGVFLKGRGNMFKTKSTALQAGYTFFGLLTLQNETEEIIGRYKETWLVIFCFPFSHSTPFCFAILMGNSSKVVYKGAYYRVFTAYYQMVCLEEKFAFTLSHWCPFASSKFPPHFPW